MGVMSVVRRTTRRTFVGAGVMVVVVAAGGYWLVHRGGGSSAAATISYRTVSVVTQTLRESVTSTGTVEPAQQASLNFGVSGRVTAVQVAAGNHVAAGQVLATVDSAQARAVLAEAQASLAGAQARLDSDTGTGATSTQLDADQAAVTSASGQVTSARTALASATLTSPIEGVVAAVDLTVGQQVAGSGSAAGSGAGSGGSNASSGTTSAQILVISDKAWIVTTSVDDTQIGLLAKGDQAQIRSASDGATVYGTISSLGLIASNTSGVAGFPVVVSVTGSPSGLHAGASAAVTLIYRQLSNVLAVPSAAVRAENGHEVVLQSKNGKQVSMPVSVGPSAGGYTQITAGLSEGAQVLVPAPRAGTSTNRSTTGRPTNPGRNFPGGGFGGGGRGGGGLGGGGLGGGGLGGSLGGGLGGG